MTAAKHLMGLGCQCQSQIGLGDVASDLTNYDLITVGGKQYSANQIVDKDLTAASNVGLYSGSNFKTPFATIKAGQHIGKVYSYIKPSQQIADQRDYVGGLLMFYTDPTFQSSSNRAYYVKDEAAINQSALKDQGTLTANDENKIVQDEQAKANDPVMYYLKKVGLPVLLIVGGGYAAVQFGKAFIDKPRPAAAVAGIKKRK